ncbi:type IV conjugative transfer system protein TraE [Bdellovibrio sp. SKB1291214]|uniref:TraE/TraK family type IV conjugative transfer system protein n=1 Tax=Bdellovibrio sp. SKB1291214 TaxID=1732569 RepID=UPI000B51AEC0|nr:TraE/TraK family type IV conjugative transfer system protein [Bdellovibrio sp. SKB1291214]UYL09871.1 type IV conjugative transfer system protein TraE [Bdellovibrio sp. SKB1291214]
METKSLIIKNYPKIVQEFARENFDLKVLSAALLAILFIMSGLIAYLVKRGPEVIALDATGAVAKLELKITDAQIASAIEEYLSYRYKWTPDTVAFQMKKAEVFIDPSLIPSFQKAMLDVQKFVKEKKVNQRVYPSDVKVDLKQMKVTVLADRITEFDSLSAATKLKVVFDFSSGDRTSLNPWGIYIRKETEGEIR